MKKRTKKRTNKQMNKRMNRQVNKKQTNELMNEQTNTHRQLLILIDLAVTKMKVDFIISTLMVVNIFGEKDNLCKLLVETDICW